MSETIDESMLDSNQIKMKKRLDAIKKELDQLFAQGFKRIPLNTFLSKMSFKYGIRPEIVRKYVTTYEGNGFFYVRDGFIKKHRPNAKKKRVKQATTIEAGVEEIAAPQPT